MSRNTDEKSNSLIVLNIESYFIKKLENYNIVDVFSDKKSRHKHF